MGQLFRQFLRKSGYALPPNEDELRREHQRCIDPTQVNDLDSMIAALVVLRERFGNVPLSVSSLTVADGRAPALSRLAEANNPHS